jgi:moderate conductance mechanosensitive channel
VRFQFLAIAKRVPLLEVSNQSSHPPVRRMQPKLSLGGGVMVAIAGTIAMAVAPMPKAIAQVPILPLLQSPNNVSSEADNRSVSGWIYLDGHQLFQIAATRSNFPERSRNIQQNLNQIRQDYLRSSTEKIDIQTPPLNGLPVIYVNDRYLMTVTPEDAKLRREEPSVSANQITEQLKKSLQLAKEERQTQYLISNDCDQRRSILLAASFKR